MTADFIRVLMDPAASGPDNMARDEALLTAVGLGQSPPTLRWYRWDPPTISLGYFQKFADYQHLAPPAGDLPVVRRLTGGGAILHDCEWTYSLTVPVDHRLLHEGANRLYEGVHDAIIDTLALLHVPAHRDGNSDGSAAHRGPFFCFQRRHCFDVLVGADKLAGSAQRRTPRAVLQHGSVVLANRYPQQPAIGVLDHIDLPPDTLLEPLLDALQHRLGAALQPGCWTPAESARIAELIHKYAGREWTTRR